eukprot:24797_1
MSGISGRIFQTKSGVEGLDVSISRIDSETVEQVHVERFEPVSTTPKSGAHKVVPSTFGEPLSGRPFNPSPTTSISPNFRPSSGFDVPPKIIVARRTHAYTRAPIHTGPWQGVKSRPVPTGAQTGVKNKTGTVTKPKYRPPGLRKSSRAAVSKKDAQSVLKQVISGELSKASQSKRSRKKYEPTKYELPDKRARSALAMKLVRAKKVEKAEQKKTKAGKIAALRAMSAKIRGENQRQAKIASLKRKKSETQKIESEDNIKPENSTTDGKPSKSAIVSGSKPPKVTITSGSMPPKSIITSGLKPLEVSATRGGFPVRARKRKRPTKVVEAKPMSPTKPPAKDLSSGLQTSGNPNPLKVTLTPKRPTPVPKALTTSVSKTLTTKVPKRKATDDQKRKVASEKLSALDVLRSRSKTPPMPTKKRKVEKRPKAVLPPPPPATEYGSPAMRAYMEKQRAERVRKLREAKQAKLEAEKKRIEKVESMKKESRLKAIAFRKREAANQKRRLERAKVELKSKVSRKETTTSSQKISIVKKKPFKRKASPSQTTTKTDSRARTREISTEGSDERTHTVTIPSPEKKIVYSESPTSTVPSSSQESEATKDKVSSLLTMLRSLTGQQTAEKENLSPDSNIIRGSVPDATGEPESTGISTKIDTDLIGELGQSVDPLRTEAYWGNIIQRATKFREDIDKFSTELQKRHEGEQPPNTTEFQRHPPIFVEEQMTSDSELHEESIPVEDSQSQRSEKEKLTVSTFLETRREKSPQQPPRVLSVSSSPSEYSSNQFESSSASTESHPEGGEARVIDISSTESQDGPESENGPVSPSKFLLSEALLTIHDSFSKASETSRRSSRKALHRVTSRSEPSKSSRSSSRKSEFSSRDFDSEKRASLEDIKNEPNTQTPLTGVPLHPLLSTRAEPSVVLGDPHSVLNIYLSRQSSASQLPEVAVSPEPEKSLEEPDTVDIGVETLPSKHENPPADITVETLDSQLAQLMERQRVLFSTPKESEKVPIFPETLEPSNLSHREDLQPVLKLEEADVSAIPSPQPPDSFLEQRVDVSADISIRSTDIQRPSAPQLPTEAISPSQNIPCDQAKVNAVIDSHAATAQSQHVISQQRTDIPQHYNRSESDRIFRPPQVPSHSWVEPIHAPEEMSLEILRNMEIAREIDGALRKVDTLILKDQLEKAELERVEAQTLLDQHETPKYEDRFP